MQLPSIQLLNAIYPTKEDSETYVGIQESTGRVMHFGKESHDCRSEIDIHNVANSCKQWAMSSHGVTISSAIYPKYSKSWDVTNDFSFIANTEPEAVFRTCENLLSILTK